MISYAAAAPAAPCFDRVRVCLPHLLQVRFAFDMTHQEITSLAAKEPPGCRGAAFLPYLGGERTPNWPHATGAILGE